MKYKCSPIVKNILFRTIKSPIKTEYVISCYTSRMASSVSCSGRFLPGELCGPIAAWREWSAAPRRTCDEYTPTGGGPQQEDFPNRQIVVGWWSRGQTGRRRDIERDATLHPGRTL